MSKKITLLGSTGSIGTQSLDVIKAQGFEVVGLAAYSNVDLLIKQIIEFKPKYVCMVEENAYLKLENELSNVSNAPKLLKGKDGLETLATINEADVVLNAVVGIAGLASTLAAINSGIDVALANKESLVTGGFLVTSAVKEKGVKLLPVDSEHSAIFQCLQDKNSAVSLQKILLTASGGPFFGFTKSQLEKVKKEDALKHPNWNMGS
ncbi:MAG: 1-deoxy-D-xylulose-5-phosphate reductoisomerase, partial [Oscillospiraceae bacterium]